jgi:hypothetical protein
MTEKDKSPGDDTEPGTAEKQPPRRTAAAGWARNADGRRSTEQLKKNQERLGVGSDHRTEAMKKGKRGTFP